MKKSFALLLVLTLVCALAACGNPVTETPAPTDAPLPAETPALTEPAPVQTVPVQTTAAKETEPAVQTEMTVYDYAAVPDEITSADGIYRIAMITDIGSTEDGSFNQGIWEGVKRYASENGFTYRRYKPTVTDGASDTLGAMNAAVEGGAKLVVCAGQTQAQVLPSFAAEHPDIHFIFVDGMVLSNPKTGLPLNNVAPIAFANEKSSYLAGYASVMEGYRSFVFSGGGGHKNTLIDAYCYGFVRGISDAAASLNVDTSLIISWKYGENYSASPELEALYTGWFQNGTEVIFPCGGGMSGSAFAAAKKTGGHVIGVDVDQSGEGPYVITSAIKGLRESVMLACGKHFDGKWAEIGGEYNEYGVREGAVGLPTESWSMQNFTLSDYFALVGKLRDGEIPVSPAGCSLIDYNKEPFPNLTIRVEE